MKLLDLFAGGGGAAYGYHLAGFDVTGVDNTPQPHYPFTFIEADALEFLDSGGWEGFDAIHASPPCQRYSVLAYRNGNAEDWPDLVGPVRERLEVTGLPWVIENVPGAPMRNPIRLCGTMFTGLRVIRHRLFEANFPLTEPAHGSHPLVFTHDKRKHHYGQLDQDTAYVQVSGGGNCTGANARDAMGIDWMIKRELNEAIPPAFTRYIGELLLSVLISASHQPSCSAPARRAGTYVFPDQDTPTHRKHVPGDSGSSEHSSPEECWQIDGSSRRYQRGPDARD